MTAFDSLFYSVFHHYKPTHKKNANTIALVYISTLQCSILLISGIVISMFLEEMNTSTMSSDKGWALFIMASVFIYFRNWIQYSGKKRKILNANRQSKIKPQLHNIWLLWTLLFVCITFSIILISM